MKMAPLNLWKTITFRLDHTEITRRLVPFVRDSETELNIDSPVGRALLVARPGQTVVARTPAGDIDVQIISIVSDAPAAVEHRAQKSHTRAGLEATQ
jgi:hypothetical protein